MNSAHRSITVAALLALIWTGSANAQFQTPGLGVPTAPTAPTGTNNEQIATTRFVKNALGAASLDAAHVVGVIPVNHGGTACIVPSGICLDNITAFSSTGMLARTAAGTYAFRALTGTANEITATNGNGVAGNPTLSLPSALTFTSKSITGGTFASGAFNGTLGATTPSTAAVTTLNVSGVTFPQITFSPSSGAIRTGVIVQGGNTLIVQSLGLANFWTFDLNSGLLSGSGTGIVLPNNVAYQAAQSGGAATNILYIDPSNITQLGGGVAVHVASTSASSSSTTGAVTVAGGIGAVGALNVGGGMSVAGVAAFGSTQTLFGGTSGIGYSQYGTSATSTSNIIVGGESGDFVIYQGTYGVSAIERFRIKATSGNLFSAGTINGIQFNAVQASGDSQWLTGLQTGINVSVLGYNNSGATNASGIPNDFAYFITGGNNAGLAFGTNANANLSIAGITGYVGIGTTAPGASLHVVGGVRFASITGPACLNVDSSGVIGTQACSGGAATGAAGSTNQVQYNGGSSTFAATSSFTYTSGTSTLAAPNLTISGTTTLGGTLHLPNNTALQHRNAANSADVNTIYLDASDVFQLGGGDSVNVASVSASTTTTDGALRVQGGIGSSGLVNAAGFGAFAGTNSRISITSNFSLSDGILLNVLNAAGSANKGLEVRATTAIFPITTLFGINTAAPGTIGTGTGAAFGISSGASQIAVTPYVDANLTTSALVVQTVDQAAATTNGGTGYEYAIVGGIKSTHNDGSLGPNKVAVAGMATMSGATSGNGWGGYFLCGLEGGSRAASICVGAEIDVNNQASTDHNYSNLGTPSYGLQLTGTSVKQNTAALLLSGSGGAPQWYAGIVFNNFRSPHSDYGIDFAFDASTSFGQSAIRLPNNQTIAWKNAAGSNINALYMDGSDIFQLGGGDPVAVASTLNVVGGYKSNGTAGVTCSAGINAATFRSVNGIVTAC